MDGSNNDLSLRGGLKLPYPKPGKVLRGRDVALLIRAINALMALQVNWTTSDDPGDGSLVFGGDFKMSDIRALLTLAAPDLSDLGSGGGTAKISPMQLVSYSTANDFFTAKNGSFTAPNVFSATGGTIDVALPWELRPAQNPGTGYALFPAVTAGDIIWVLETDAGENGVYVSGAELTLMDLGLGRTWQGASVIYGGVYDATKTYAKSTIVVQNSGSSQGVWINVASGGSTGVDPVWPQPSATGGTDTWQLFAFGVQLDSVCAGGAKSQYINAGAPF